MIYGRICNIKAASAKFGVAFLLSSTPSFAQNHAFSEEWPEFKKPTTIAESSESFSNSKSDKPAKTPEPFRPISPQDKAVNQEVEVEGGWLKKLGKSIVIRGTDERLYIQAGETRIVLDQSGDLTISSSNSLTIGSKKNIFFKAGEDIQFQAGGKVVQQGGSP